MSDDAYPGRERPGTAATTLRHCAMGLLATAAGGALLLLLLQLLRGAPVQALFTSPGTVGIETLVSAVVTGCGALLAAWYTLSAAGGTICAGVRLLGSTWSAGEHLLRRRGAPGMARVLGAGSGAVLAAGLALVPAQAAAPPSQEAPAAEDLSWGADRPPPAEPDGQEQTAAAVSPSGGPAAGPAPTSTGADEADAPTTTPGSGSPQPGGTAASSPTDYEVRTGDTLWDIAAAHLPDDASAADIAASWPLWYRANQSVIGADPDVIRPGTTLHPPDVDTTTSTSKGAT